MERERGPEKLGLLVPTDRAGFIIGKAGAGLKQIREATGCSVTIEQQADPNGYRRADVHGASSDQLAGAFQQIAGKVFHNHPADQPASLTVLLPSDKAGGVIGKGGENLKRIREATHVSVTVEREPVIDPRTGQQERMAVFQGAPQYMGAAMRIAIGGPGGAGGGFGMLGGPYGGVAAYGSFGGGAIGASYAASAYLAAAAAAAGASPPRGTMGAPGRGPAVPWSGGAALSQVRPPSQDPNDVQVHVVIPDSFAGAILGKDGAQVKQTTTTTGCKSISVTRRDGSAERRVVIIGGLQQSAAAQKAIHGQYAEAGAAAGIDTSQVSVIFFIPKTAAGAVIGKEAVTLKQIREASGIKLTVGRDEVEEQRPCIINGPLQNVLQAERLIYAQVMAEAATNPPGASQALGAALGGALGVAPNSAFAKKRTPEAVAAPTPSPKRPRVADGAAATTTKLLVPAQSAGAVIGKQGSGLRTLREAFGVQVELLQQVQAPQWPNDRVVILSGTAAARTAALEALLKIAFQMDEQNVLLKILVPASAAGGIIGKQGSGLRAIRESSGIGVQVEREEVAGERLVSARGALASVSAAAAHVLAMLENAGGGAAAAGWEQGLGSSGFSSQAPAQEGWAGSAEGFSAAGWSGAVVGEGY